MLGICCMWVELDSKNRIVSSLPQKNLQLGRLRSYSDDFIKQAYLTNLRGVMTLLQKSVAAGIRFVRISSSLFPLYDVVDRGLWDNDEIRAELNKIGQFISTAGLRVNTHPGQCFVLSSDTAATVDAAVKELDFNGWVFDRLGLPRTPYFNINVHGGKGDRADSLVRGIDRLSPEARSRLTIENCEFAYTVEELYQVSLKTGVPVVVDVHHHSINPGGLSVKDALALGVSTWPTGVRPTTHLSNSKPEHANGTPSKRRIHSDYIHEFQPDLLSMHNAGLLDVEVEAKAKNLAISALVGVVSNQGGHHGCRDCGGEGR